MTNCTWTRYTITKIFFIFFAFCALIPCFIPLLKADPGLNVPPLYDTSGETNASAISFFQAHRNLVNRQVYNNTTPVAKAAIDLNTYALAAFLSMGGKANQNIVNNHNFPKPVPLLEAVIDYNSCDSKELLPVIKLLVSHGANVNATDTFGYTALSFATRQNQKLVVQYLLVHGAKVDKWTKKILNSRLVHYPLPYTTADRAYIIGAANQPFYGMMVLHTNGTYAYYQKEFDGYVYSTSGFYDLTGNRLILHGCVTMEQWLYNGSSVTDLTHNNVFRKIN